MTPIEIGHAIRLMQSGKTLIQVSKELGISYQRIWRACRRRGFAGGKRQRDTRPIKVKLMENIRTHPNGCIEWTRARIYFGKKICTLSNYGNILYGEFKYQQRLRSCPTKGCLNQGHYLGRNSVRDKEIVDAWNNYIRHKTSLKKIAAQYGLTKVRIQQIIQADRERE